MDRMWYSVDQELIISVEDTVYDSSSIQIYVIPQAFKV